MPAAKCRPSSRPWSRLWDEVSIATCVQPRAASAASVACRSTGPGVVRLPAVDGTSLPAPSNAPSVPTLPAVPAALNRYRTSPVVVVLPLVPVMPMSTSDAPGSPYQARASSIAASRASVTTSCGTSTGWRASTTAAAAPRAMASGTKRCPSDCEPRTATKSAPARTSRLSAVSDVSGGSVAASTRSPARCSASTSAGPGTVIRRSRDGRWYPVRPHCRPPGSAGPRCRCRAP